MTISMYDYIADIIKEATDLKQAGVRAYELLKHGSYKLSAKRLEDIHDCRNLIKYAYGEDVEAEKMYGKALYMESCKYRMCPACQRADAIADGIRLYTCLNFLRLEKHKRFIFITLTVPNVPGAELKNKMREMNKAYDKLMRRKQFEQFTSGVAKMEITYNAKANTFHPHLHAILVVDADYFDKSNSEYLTHDQLLKHWQSVMNDESITQVDVRAVKNYDGSDDFENAVLELSKYTAKDYEYANHGQEVFDYYHNALRGAKTLRVAGELRMLVNVYDMDVWGLLEAYKPASEHFEDYDYKTVSDYNFKNKSYNTLLTELTDDERAEITRRVGVRGYADFCDSWTNTNNDYLDALTEQAEQEKQFAKYKASKQSKLRLANTESKIKRAKQKQQRLKRKLDVFAYVDNNLRDKFVC